MAICLDNRRKRNRARAQN